MRNIYRILVGKFEGKSQVRRPRRMWEDNIKMALKWDIRAINCSHQA
jgi:hypothetical protein